jgi:hypothetical protein
MCRGDLTVKFVFLIWEALLGKEMEVLPVWPKPNLIRLMAKFTMPLLRSRGSLKRVIENLEQGSGGSS